MDSQTAVALLQALGAKQIQKSSEWVRSSCVLAKWTHAKGSDSHPSFGIKLGTKSHYYCFACQKHGSPMDLVLELMHLNKDKEVPLDLVTAFQLADEPEPEGYTPVEDWKATPDVKPMILWDEEWLKSFPLAWETAKGKAYLESRKVTKQIALELEIRYDASKDTICFPVRNRDGQLIGMRGRFLHESTNRFHDYAWQGHRNHHLWLNAHRVDLLEPVLVVESSFDLARCFRHYQNVTAPLAAGISAESVSWLKSAISITLFFDNDQGGTLAADKMIKYLGKFIPVTVLEYPEGTEGEDPGSLPEAVLTDMLKQHLPV